MGRRAPHGNSAPHLLWPERRHLLVGGNSLAQLYRDEITNRLFRQRELAAVNATLSRLRQLLGQRA